VFSIIIKFTKNLFFLKKIQQTTTLIVHFPRNQFETIFFSKTLHSNSPYAYLSFVCLLEFNCGTRKSFYLKIHPWFQFRFPFKPFSWLYFLGILKPLPKGKFSLGLRISSFQTHLFSVSLSYGLLAQRCSRPNKATTGGYPSTEYPVQHPRVRRTARSCVVNSSSSIVLPLGCCLPPAMSAGSTATSWDIFHRSTSLLQQRTTIKLGCFLVCSTQGGLRPPKSMELHWG
jgi:hypothetical protein